VVRRWPTHAGTGRLFIELGAPWQDGIAESVNGRLRGELLSSEILDAMVEATHLLDR
jgi:hypothetical protein